MMLKGRPSACPRRCFACGSKLPPDFDYKAYEAQLAKEHQAFMQWLDFIIPRIKRLGSDAIRKSNKSLDSFAFKGVR